jgi:hypothetical protein
MIAVQGWSLRRRRIFGEDARKHRHGWTRNGLWDEVQVWWVKSLVGMGFKDDLFCGV